MAKIPIRYVRDYCGGSDYNISAVWIELKVFRDGVNIANGITATSNVNLTGNIAWVTDNITTNPGNYVSHSSQTSYVQVDLGQVYSDLENIQIWHWYGDGRKFSQNITQVSADGVNWTVLFNSEIDGRYVETSEGRTTLIPNAKIPMRFARFGSARSNVDSNAVWNEIKIFRYGQNIAYGILPTSSVQLSAGPSRLTDGVISNTVNCFTLAGNTPRFVQVDLGEIYTDIDYMTIWQFEGRTFQSVTAEISTDGINYTKLFDSEIDGRYVDTNEGKTFTIPTVPNEGTIFLNLIQETSTSDVISLDLIQEITASDDLSLNLIQEIATTDVISLNLIQELSVSDVVSLDLIQEIAAEKIILCPIVQTIYRTSYSYLEIESSIHRIDSIDINLRQEHYKTQGESISLDEIIYRNRIIPLKLIQNIISGDQRISILYLDQTIYRIDQSMITTEQRISLNKQITIPFLIQFITPTIGEVGLSLFIRFIDYSSMIPIIGKIPLKGKRELFSYLKGNIETILTIKGGIPLTYDNQDISMTSGDSKVLVVTMDEPMDFDGVDLKWGIRKNRKTKENVVIKTSTNGIAINDQVIEVKIDPIDTQEIAGDYYHEMELTDIFGNVSTIFVGKVHIDHDGV